MNKKELQNYIKRMTDIRILSSPTIGELDSAWDYSERLKENFKRIGVLASENRQTLEEIIFPLAESDTPLNEDEIALIREFNDSLVDYSTVENLDSAIMSLLSDRLMKDAQSKDDEMYLIKELHNQVVVCHTFMYMTSRIATNPEISGHFRERGLSAAHRLMEYLDKDKFPLLTDEAKDNVLMMTRFHATLYGSASGITTELLRDWLKALDFALKIYNDPFYHENTPGYDWDYYLFRTYEYYSAILDYSFTINISREDITLIKKMIQSQEDMWQSDPETFEKYSIHPMVLISLYQAKFLSGDLTGEEYRALIFDIYKDRNRRAYDFDNLFVNLRCVMDTMQSFKGIRIPEKDKAVLGQFYHDVCGYIFHMQNSGTLSELLELYTPILYNFIEIPGKISFEEMCLRSLAAFHPPTYVHSVMVAHLSLCICRHLIKLKPQLFIGMPGCKNEADVNDNYEKILDFTYHSALCHDFGKLGIIDTVFIYGRRLLDFEFDIIKQHPDLGVRFMERNESTAEYVDIARGHHKWYDNTKGYPMDFDTSKSQYKTIIDIVACADCMDAATDSIGRSYNQGKTLNDFKTELREGAGTRYAPYLIELIDRPEVFSDLNYLLCEGRNINYRNTYLLLTEVTEMSA
ncbi:MAG: HD domain-containing protein [Lachnospiraceae bacterium]|nr:HD domain-containing protein [Lachnospiraceae bacterium]